MPTRSRALLALAALGVGSTLVLSSCSPADAPPAPPAASSPSPAPDPLEAAGVAAGHPLAADAGAGILASGGNAVDAAIAAAFADTVLQPDASSIGGGGSAIIADSERIDYVDYRDEVNLAGVVPAAGAGIPGFLAGMDALHERYGRLEWAALLEPAIALARDGAPMSAYLAGQLRFLPGGTAAHPAFADADGAPLTAGATLVQTELAQTLSVIAAEGSDAFYSGSLVASVTAADGIDAESLAAYEVQWSDPPEGEFGDSIVVSASPALPGAALIQQLQVEQALGIADAAPAGADFIDIQTRAWRIAERSIQTVIGDPMFVDVPIETLTDPAENARLAESSVDGEAAAAIDPAAEVDGNTTHVSVVDQEGLTVSMTNTVTNFWGSGQRVGGFFLNDSLERFDDIGVAGFNAPQPGARSVSWSAPSLVLDDERRPVLVIGLPGGRQIPSSLATVIALWEAHDYSVEQAVLAPRSQLLANGILRVESADAADELRARGYVVEVHTDRAFFGSVQALEIDWDARSVEGFADPRRAAGVSIVEAEGPTR